MNQLQRRFGTALVALSLAITATPAAPATAAPAAPAVAPAALAAPAAGTTSAREARRVDRVPAPKLRWKEAEDGSGYSATVRLPRDYDKPKGATVKLALFKIPAADPKRRIGTLFLNPGGPGGSGVAIARTATRFLSQEVLDRFDVIGFDPRGTNASSQVRCFSSTRRQERALTGMEVEFPVGSAEEKRYLASAKRQAQACSERILAASVSTAEVARDLDVLRRAVGDRQLSYLGFSYGTYLGAVYAAMFPDRVRALALDGVVDPSAWIGGAGTRTPVSLRIRSAEGAWKALQVGLQACADAGPGYCPLADPKADFDRVAAALRDQGSVLLDDAAGGIVYTYQDLVADALALLYYAGGIDYIAQVVADLDDVLAAESEATLQRSSSRLASLVRSFRRAVATSQLVLASGYDNELDAYSSVICADGYQPRSPSDWISATHAADARAPHFGRLWGWSDAQCATRYWKATDEDRYRGGFAVTTANPVLVIGNYYDPATNYDNAVHAASLLANSYLLRSDSWGHTAYGTSDCVTDRVDAYLIAGKAPADDVCTGDVRPFTTPLADTSASPAKLAKVVARAGLPPVVQPWGSGRA